MTEPKWRDGPPPRDPDGTYPRIVVALIHATADVAGRDEGETVTGIYRQHADGSLVKVSEYGYDAETVTFLRHFIVPPDPKRGLGKG